MEKRSKHGASPILYIVSIIFQTALFLCAAAALALFYLSYRTADFTESLIFSGLALSGPWLLISVLPTFFGLEDTELRKEIWLRQIISMLVILGILIGLAVYIDFHRELWEQIRSYLLTSASFLDELWQTIASYISQGLKYLTTFYNEHLLSFLST